MSERKKVIKAMNSTFIEDQQKMSESRSSELAELEKTQQERAQQIEILSLDSDHVSENDDVTENSSNENDENLNSIDNENINENDLQLDATIRSGQTVRLTEKM